MNCCYFHPAAHIYLNIYKCICFNQFSTITAGISFATSDLASCSPDCCSSATNTEECEA